MACNGLGQGENRKGNESAIALNGLFAAMAQKKNRH